MTEYDQTVCPRCGRAGGDSRFCRVCGFDKGSPTAVRVEDPGWRTRASAVEADGVGARVVEHAPPPLMRRAPVTPRLGAEARTLESAAFTRPVSEPDVPAEPEPSVSDEPAATLAPAGPDEHRAEPTEAEVPVPPVADRPALALPQSRGSDSRRMALLVLVALVGLRTLRRRGRRRGI